METDTKDLSVQEKIELYEKNGWFDIDTLPDPETITLLPDKVDYLGEKLSSKIQTFFANFIAKTFIKKLIKRKKLIIKEIIGIENINNIDSGFLVTCNHFNPFDNFAMHKVIWTSKHNKHKKFYKVIREGNFTDFRGIY